MFGSVTIGRWGSLLLGAFVLTIGNTILKPILPSHPATRHRTLISYWR
jgi:hypothetical protein